MEKTVDVAEQLERLCGAGGSVLFAQKKPSKEKARDKKLMSKRFFMADYIYEQTLEYLI